MRKRGSTDVEALTSAVRAALADLTVEVDLGPASASTDLATAPAAPWSSGTPTGVDVDVDQIAAAVLHTLVADRRLPRAHDVADVMAPLIPTSAEVADVVRNQMVPLLPGAPTVPSAAEVADAILPLVPTAAEVADAVAPFVPSAAAVTNAVAPLVPTAAEVADAVAHRVPTAAQVAEVVTHRLVPLLPEEPHVPSAAEVAAAVAPLLPNAAEVAGVVARSLVSVLPERSEVAAREERLHAIIERLWMGHSALETESRVTARAVAGLAAAYEAKSAADCREASALRETVERLTEEVVALRSSLAGPELRVVAGGGQNKRRSAGSRPRSAS